MTASEFVTNFSSMNAERKTANAVGGKTARACDSCLRRRARWYCAADDAFLCQVCDSLVHSANQLASRHERVRLKTASFKHSESTSNDDIVPAWQGFTRKARTPRQTKPGQNHHFKDKERIINTSSLVPKLGSEEASEEDETEAQLLYRVPIFDPFAAELCNVSNEVENLLVDCKDEAIINLNEPNVFLSSNTGNEGACDLDNLPLFLPSEMELEEFAADVETLLGKGFDEESCGIEALGLIECKEENVIENNFEGSGVKLEDEEQAIIASHFDPGLDGSAETIDWDFDYDSPMTGEDLQEEVKVEVVAQTEMTNSDIKEGEKKMFLRLNYDEVITSWDNKGCPWTSGIRPEFNPDDCWTDFMGLNEPGTHQTDGGEGGRNDGGREARVSRYREKRRTRLFSKKIRYEVRKLNAEKRPRMKGRFVKRTSFAGGPAALPYQINK
ncbi:hypothetical protein AgCh_008187 [Apium graveolens]